MGSFDMGQASGLLIDCDGTLLDTLGAWADAEQVIWREAGDLTDAQMVAVHSAPITEAARILHEVHGVGTSAEALLAHFDEALLDYYRTQAQEMPGARAFLEEAARAHVPMAVVSSSPQRYLQAGLGRCGMLEYFDAVVSTEDVGSAKSEPAIYGHALALIGADWAGAWGVDDAPYAVRAMARAGLKVIGAFADERSTRADELRAAATVYVRTLDELV